jgi:hypothetical protein
MSRARFSAVGCIVLVLVCAALSVRVGGDESVAAVIAADGAAAAAGGDAAVALVAPADGVLGGGPSFGGGGASVISEDDVLSPADVLVAEIAAAEALIELQQRRVAALSALRAAVLGGARLIPAALAAALALDATTHAHAPVAGAAAVGAGPAPPLPAAIGVTFESMLAAGAGVGVAGRGAVTAMEMLTLVPRAFRARRGGGAHAMVNALHALVTGTADGTVAFHNAATGALMCELRGALGPGAAVTGLAHDTTYDAPLLVAGSDGTLAVVAITSWIDGRLNWGASNPVNASNEVPLPAADAEEGGEEEAAAAAAATTSSTETPAAAAASAAPTTGTAPGGGGGAGAPPARGAGRKDPNAPTSIGTRSTCIDSMSLTCVLPAPPPPPAAGHALRATVLTRVSTAAYDASVSGLATPPAISACALYVMRRMRFLIVGDTEGSIGVFSGNGTLLHVSRPPPPEAVASNAAAAAAPAAGAGAGAGATMPLRVSVFTKAGPVLAFARGASIGFLNVVRDDVVGDVVCRGGAARVVGLAYDALTPGYLWAGTEAGDLLGFNTRIRTEAQTLCKLVAKVPLAPGGPAFPVSVKGYVIATAGGDRVMVINATTSPPSVIGEWTGPAAAAAGAAGGEPPRVRRVRARGRECVRRVAPAPASDARAPAGDRHCHLRHQHPGPRANVRAHWRLPALLRERAGVRVPPRVHLQRVRRVVVAPAHVRARARARARRRRRRHPQPHDVTRSSQGHCCRRHRHRLPDLEVSLTVIRRRREGGVCERERVHVCVCVCVRVCVLRLRVYTCLYVRVRTCVRV